jgi:hypothetical protein
MSRIGRLAIVLAIGAAGLLLDVAPSAATTAPGPPVIVSVIAGNRTMTVTWKPPANDGGSPITGYDVQVDGGITESTGAGARSLTSSGWNNDHVWQVRVIAKNSAGSGTPSAWKPFTPHVTGYWMMSGGGQVYAFGEVARYSTLSTMGETYTDIEPAKKHSEFWRVTASGRVTATADLSVFYGPNGPVPVNPDAIRSWGNVAPNALFFGETVVSMSATRTDHGYWLVTNRGRVFAFGDAHFYGDMRNVPLNGPILDSVATPSGNGYYMVASDGGIFAFGDARFRGSMGGHHLNAPVVGLAPDADNIGYWLVARDGGIFAFDAPFRGSMGGTRLNGPVIDAVRFGNGYLMIGSDGGIFNFSNKQFYGSLLDVSGYHSTPIVAVAATG